MESLRASHVFLWVDVFIDEKRVGRHGTYMRVHAESTCKDVLALFLSSHQISRPFLREPSSFSHVRYRDDDFVVVAFVVAFVVHVVVVAFDVVVAAHVAHNTVFDAAGTS